MYLKFLQSSTGLLISTFSLPHLLGHLTSLSSIHTANKMLELIRVFAHNPVFEATLFIAIPLHITTSIILYAKRKPASMAKKLNGGLDVHRLAGMFLALTIFGHILATR